MLYFNRKRYFLSFFVILFGTIHFQAQNTPIDSLVFQDFPIIKFTLNGKPTYSNTDAIIRSRSYSKDSTPSSTYYHDIYTIDKNNNQVQLYGGKVSGYTKKLENFDFFDLEESYVNLVTVKYFWDMIDFTTNKKQNVFVQEYYYFNEYSGDVIRLEKFSNEEIEFIGWGEHKETDYENYLPVNKNEVFKIKRIAIDSLTNVTNPQENLKYALLTPKGFYRFLTTQEKDSIILTSEPKIEKTGPFTEIAAFQTQKSNFCLIYNYSAENPDQFVSALDIKSFNHHVNPLLKSNQHPIIVWEKANPLTDWINFNLKAHYINDFIFNDKEISQFLEDISIIEYMFDVIFRDQK